MLLILYYNIYKIYSMKSSKGGGGDHKKERSSSLPPNTLNKPQYSSIKLLFLLITGGMPCIG
jgi:hypothetical protein